MHRSSFTRKEVARTNAAAQAVERVKLSPQQKMDLTIQRNAELKAAGKCNSHNAAKEISRLQNLISS